MKEATLPASQPQSEEEIKREIDRLFGEMEQMLDRIGRNNAEAARLSKNVDRNIQWIKENLHVGKAT